MRFAKSLAILALCVVSALSSHLLVAQTFTDLHDYNPSVGEPYEFLSAGYLAQGRDGKLYGVSHFGGTSDIGTIFATNPSNGVPTVLDSLDTTTGAYPFNGLVLGTDGNFYGAGSLYGSGGAGTIFKVTPAGLLTILHNFANTGDGGWPTYPPIIGADGNFYGVASGNDEGAQFTSVFYRVTPAGVFAALHTFNSSTEGTQCAAIVLGSDGNFWGGCNLGGANNDGTLFKITPAGVVTPLHSFNGTDGQFAANGVTQGKDGNYYGTTYNGGSANLGVLFQLKTSGAYTVLHQFTGAADGSLPLAPLTLATDGNIYGTTSNGGNTTCPNGCGTAFKLTAAGQFSTIQTFDGTHGSSPQSALTQRTDGMLYGNTLSGGAHGGGVFYRLNLSLQPFISLQSTAGKVGQKIGILGQGFAKTSVVKFNGVTATTIAVTGSSFITATVPAGATNGLVTVTTGSTTLTSSQKFIVHDSWMAGAGMPTAVKFESAGFISGKVYVVGGVTNTAVVANNQVYNTASNTWAAGAPIPVPIFGAASAVVNGTLYIFGGSSDNVTQTNAVWAYSPTNNTWSSKAAMPEARSSASAVVVNNLIYVIGGFSSGTRATTVESYNTTTNTWSSLAGLLVGKSEPSVGVLNGSIVAAGGYTSSQDTGDNESYKISTNTWTNQLKEPTSRNASCYGALSGQLYVIAGGDNGAAQTVNESFNLTTNKWTTHTPITNAVIASAPAIANNLLYCFGGGSTDTQFTGTVFNSVQIYQP